MTKRAYALRPVRYEYELTPKGADLFSVLRKIVEWPTVTFRGRPWPGWLERAAKEAVARARDHRRLGAREERR